MKTFLLPIIAKKGKHLRQVHSVLEQTCQYSRDIMNFGTVKAIIRKIWVTIVNICTHPIFFGTKLELLCLVLLISDWVTRLGRLKDEVPLGGDAAEAVHRLLAPGKLALQLASSQARPDIPFRWTNSLIWISVRGFWSQPETLGDGWNIHLLRSLNQLYKTLCRNHRFTLNLLLVPDSYMIHNLIESKVSFGTDERPESAGIGEGWILLHLVWQPVHTAGLHGQNFANIQHHDPHLQFLIWKFLGLGRQLH